MTNGMEGERQRNDGPPCIHMYMYMYAHKDNYDTTW